MKTLLNHGKNWLKEAWDGWTWFWFQPANPTTLGVMRWFIGGMLIYSHLVWGLDLELLIGPDGWHSTDAMQSLQQDQSVWSFWWLVPVGAMWTVHWICLVVLVCFFVGFLTPLTGVLAFVISASYMYRAPMANYGMDQILSCLIFYLAISPCGKTWSMDWLIARYRAIRSAINRGETQVDFSVAPSVRANVVQRLIQVQFCIVYLFAGTAKLQGTSWWTGMAMWQAFSNLEYQSFDMTWLAFYPIILNLITHMTIVWELSFSVLVWNRFTRPIIFLMGIGMHLGIGALMGMWTFGLIMIFGYLAFCPGDTLCRWLNSWNWKLTSVPEVEFHPSNASSVRKAAWQKTWDFQNSIVLICQEPKANARPGTSLADMDVGGLFKPAS